MGTNSVVIKMVDSVEEAPTYGPTIKGISLESALIVKGGTVGGRPTVDLCFTDEDNAQYVAIVTGAILDGIAAVVRSAQGENP